jgi:hypothetical protein
MSEHDSNLPRDVAEALHSMHGVSAERLERIADTRVLRDVAMGTRRGVSTGERTRALALLGRRREPDVSEWVLRSVAKDHDERPLVRAAAARALRYLPPGEAERASLDLLDSDVDAVRAVAFANLGVIGGERTHERLSSARFGPEGALGSPERFGDHAGRCAAFAKALVAYRVRDEESPRFAVEGTARRELERGDGEEITSEPVDSVDDVLATMTEPSYGISVRADDALELITNDETATRLTLVVNDEIADDPVGELTERPALFALALYHATETDEHEPGLVGFSRPDGEGVDVTFCRTDGRAVYAGRGTVVGDALELSLTDTGVVGTTPTVLRLRLGPSGFSLEEGRTDLERAVSRSPEPLDR